MKKLLIVDVPEGETVYVRIAGSHNDNTPNLDYSIVTLPSEEEIVIKATTEGDKAAKQDPKLPEFLKHRDFSVSYGFQSGVHWLLTKIKGE